MEDEQVRENIYILQELIKDLKVAMLTTVSDLDGSLRSRPMIAQNWAFDGDLWFLTKASAPKVGEVEYEEQVNISYVDTEKRRYISISGIARLVFDRKVIKRYWNPSYLFWFSQGLEDPDLAFLKVTVYKAEFWDMSAHKNGKVLQFARTLVKGNL